MGTKNVTLTLDEDLLTEARVLAARRHTSVSGLVREQLYDHAPRGAWWAESHGCGLDVIDPPADETWAIDCGIGHVPEGSRRFLFFYDPMADWR